MALAIWKEKKPDMASLPGEMEQEMSQFERKLLGELRYSACAECGAYR